jgi:D-alanyl-D-alanine carboxypeptidase
MTVADLLRGLMLESANDAAVTLAESVAGSRTGFVRRMNKRARELGLRNTRYSNPIGLDAPGNFSSARDLARLAVVVRRHRFLRKLADRTSATLTTGDRPRTIRNRNLLLSRDRFVNGLKTGHTGMAGYVLVATRTHRRVTLVSVVLGAQSPAARDHDALALLQWGASRYERIHPVTEGTVVGPARDRVSARRDARAGDAGVGAPDRAHSRADHRRGRRRPVHRRGADQARPALRLPRGACGRSPNREGADRVVGRGAGGGRVRADEGLGHEAASRCCSPAWCWRYRAGGPPGAAWSCPSPPPRLEPEAA